MYFQRLITLLAGASVIVAAPTSLEGRNNGCSTGVSASRSAQIQNAFRSSGVIPTLIPSIDPKLEVTVNYGNKAVDLGNQFTIPETLLAPTLTFNGEAGCEPSDTTYSYFMIDPDVPNPDGVPLHLTFLHWFVSGAQPDCVSNQKARTVAMYQPLSPASTQQHRYTFLVYREPKGYKPDILTPLTRLNFDINAYAAKEGLTLVGGNFLREALQNGVIPTST